MACIKCGKKTQNEQTFCPGCLQAMEAYPVRRDVHVQLPNRPEEPAKKSGKKKRTIPPEEQVVFLRRRLRRLTLVTVVLAMLLGAAVFLLVKASLVEAVPPLGQNYGTEESAD